MDPQGSTPGQPEGGQVDPSPQQNPADNAAQNEQPSQGQDNQDDGVRYSSDEATGNQGNDDAPSQTNNDADDTQDDDTSGVDPELTRWAASQNLELTTETEINLAKRLRDTQAAYHKTNQGPVKDITNEQTDGGSSVMEAKVARMEFLEKVPEARALEKDMADYAFSLKDAGDDAGFEYYRTHWDQLFAIVKAQKASSDGDGSYDAGRADERKNLARKQQASAPAKGAVDSAPKDTRVTDAQIAEMTPAQYQQYKKDNPSFNPFG